MRRIALAFLAALAVVASIGPATAAARGNPIVPTPGLYVGEPNPRTGIKVSFQLTKQDKIVEFTDGTNFTAAKPKPVFTVHRDDPQQFPDDPMVWFQECDQFCIWGFWKTPTEVVGKYYPPGRPDFNRDFEVQLEKAPSK